MCSECSQLGGVAGAEVLVLKQAGERGRACPSGNPTAPCQRAALGLWPRHVISLLFAFSFVQLKIVLTLRTGSTHMGDDRRSSMAEAGQGSVFAHFCIQTENHPQSPHPHLSWHLVHRSVYL